MYDGKTNGYRIEKRLKCKSGRYVWLDSNITSIRDTAGAIERLIALAVDITEKKSATESLNVFFEQPMNLHLIATVEGKILRVNSGWKTILGYEKEELVAFSFLDFSSSR